LIENEKACKNCMSCVELLLSIQVLQSFMVRMKYKFFGE